AVKVVAQAGSVSVETGFPPQKTWGFSDRVGAVNYEISVPRTVKISRLDVGNGDVQIGEMYSDIQANLVNGGLAAHNCFGKSRLSVANGTLDLIYEKWERRDFSVDARIISGDVRAFLPGTASFHIVAEAVNGNVLNHFTPMEKHD